MVRFVQLIVYALAIAGATFFPTYLYAQNNVASPLSTPTSTTTGSNVIGTPTPGASNDEASASSIRSQIGTVTATTTISSESDSDSEAEALPTVELTGTLPSQITSTVPISVGSDIESEPLEGTILANRSDVVARFFVEGQTYQLAAGRSQGLKLPRASTVLNLFNCDGSVSEDTAGCFWDPYLIQQDGFYEIFNAAAENENATLMLREAGAPPTGQVWVQNRTGQTESVVFREEVHDIAPTSVLELPVATGVPAILYVRSCLSVDNQLACEWAPRTLNAGVYYAMIEVDTPGTSTGNFLTSIDLRPVVGASASAGAGESEEAASAEVAPNGPSILCSVVVPALNIRSGPGLQYDIIGKVRTTEGGPGTVTVTGRSSDNEWLTVDDEAVVGGWINNSPSFITCSSDVTTLPIVEAPALPTPLPVTVLPTPVPQDTAQDTSSVPPTQPEEAPPVQEPVPVETPEPADESPAAPSIPDGQALLIVNNGFQHQMRFTIDQMYRPVEGPSEYDLQPGESVGIVVYPGDIPFTASTPWSGLSSNATVHVDADQSATLWLRFELDQGGNWVFRWD